MVSVGTPQFAWDPEMQKIARRLFTQRDALGKTEVVIWAARSGFLEKNKAAMIDFMEDMLEVPAMADRQGQSRGSRQHGLGVHEDSA